MRFLMYEADNSASANTPPSPPVMAEVGKFERAAALTRNARERELLLERAAACSRS